MIEDRICSRNLRRNLYRNSRVSASQCSYKAGSPPHEPTDLSNLVISVPSRRGRSTLRHLDSLGAVAAHSRSPIMIHSSGIHPTILNIWCVVRTLSVGPVIQQVPYFDALPFTLWVSTGWTAHLYHVRTIPYKRAEDSTQHSWDKPTDILERTLSRKPSNNESFTCHFAHGEHKVFVALADIEVLLINN